MTTTTMAAEAYARAAQMGAGSGVEGAAKLGAAEAEQPNFASFIKDTLSDAVAQGKDAEKKAVTHVGGEGELIDVVTAISAAEATLETVIAVRDRVISAYQEISRMPI